MNKTIFKTVINDYLKEAKSILKPSTYSSFLLISENHLKIYFGKKRIEEIDEIQIQKYILYLNENGRLDGKGGLTVKTIRDIILVLRLTLNYAAQHKIISFINWDMIKYPKEDRVLNINSLSKEEQLELIQAIYLNMNRKTVGIMLSLMVGLRIGELCGLKMSDISISERTLSVSRTVQRIYDKKKGKSKIIIGTPKTKSSARIIPLPTMLIKILKDYITDDSEDYFLTGKRSPSEPRTIRAYFKRFLKRNNLRQIKFHELRHTFAIRAIEIPDFDVKSLSEILGHKNVSFTLNVYGSANMQQKVKCMNLLNELL